MKKQKFNWVVVPAALLVVIAVVVLLVMAFGGGTPSDGTPKPTATPKPSNSDSQNNNDTPNTPATADAGAVQELVNLFNEAYFVADAEAIKNYLADSYSGDAPVYAGNGAISDITITVQADVTGAAVGTVCPVQVRYADSEAGDTYQYLTLEVVRQATGWKVQTYSTGA